MATKKSKEETDVILVVKGAGEQAEDDHLNIFLRGFWPAIISLDKEATIAQVKDELDGYEPSPHNQDGNSHKHLTEIRANYMGVERRIWVKESYWEAETLPSSALDNLSKEWRMSSFVFANMFREIFFSRNTKKLKEQRQSGQKLEFQPGVTPGTRTWDYIGNYISYILLFMLVFLPFSASSTSSTWFKETLDKILAAIHIPSTGFNEFMLLLVAAAIWAVAPAYELSVGVYKYIKQNKGGILKSLPGLPGWILLAMIFLLVNDPLGYSRFLLTLLALQVTLLVSRRILWKYRTYANSDVDLTEYYVYPASSGSAGEKEPDRFGKVDEPGLTRLFFTPLLYRYIIFLTLPVTFAGTILVKILRWTRILGGLGEALDGFINTALVGYMDDVVNFAMDPAQAHRVRSAVRDDIIYFHKKRPEVRRIHIVAHSQGTPITYETLFHFLEPKHQKKIYTYVTLGSVLSYYNQARGILDKVYHERFPVSPAKTQNFPDGFKWMNFWNFTDPITEFYGLDEYTSFEGVTPDDKLKRSRTSPTNIRTHSSLLENHSEYWNNLEQFTLPFAKRVLGALRPIEWNPEFSRKEKFSEINPRDWEHYRHHVSIALLWLLITAVAGFGGYWLVMSGRMDFISNYFSTLKNSGLAVYNIYNPPEGNGASSANRMLINNLRRQILDGSFVLLAVWIVFDWINQLRRIFQIRRKPKIESE